MKPLNYNNFSVPLFSSSYPQIQAIQYGYEKCSPDKPITAQKNFAEYSLHYVISGSGYISYNNEPVKKVKKGDMFFLLPQNDFYYYPDKKKPWEYFWINFNATNISQFLNILDVSPSNPIFPCTEKNLIQKTLLDNINMCAKNIHLAPFFTTSTCYKIFGLLLDGYLIEGTLQQQTTHIEQAVNFIESNISNCELSLSMLADFLHLNSSYLSRLFLKKLGVSFNHYLSAARINKAVELLTNGERSLKVVSELCGFNSQYYFSTIFKRKHQIPPSEYLEQLDKKKDKDNQ